MTNRMGQQIGNYRLVQLLGSGGFADVYLGQHIHLKKRQVAIKILKASLDEKYASTFSEEAQTVADLKHANIIQLLDYGIESTPYLIMEYAQKGTLRDIYPKGSVVPLSVIIQYIEQIAAALQYAHDQRIIHRDVKPQNLLVRNTNEIVLSDFGIATIAHNTTSLHTGDYHGTLHYSAPEQLRGKPRPASDQYALGIITYEWLCGNLPFTGFQTEIVVMHLTEPPQPLHQRMPTISPAVEAVVMRTLEKEADHRFDSVYD